MTEAEWLACEDIERMQHWWVVGRTIWPRRERLFACACCRRRWGQLTDPRSQAAIEAAESYADGVIDKPTLARAQMKALRAARAAPRRRRWIPEDATHVLCHLTLHDVFTAASTRARYAIRNPRSRAAMKQEAAAQAALLRDIFGNPFRPGTFSQTWRTSTVVALARQMYGSRDFGAMPILADALQDAGCDSDDILSHCRGPGPHVRGCWVVDLVLGKA